MNRIINLFAEQKETIDISKPIFNIEQFVLSQNDPFANEIYVSLHHAKPLEDNLNEATYYNYSRVKVHRDSWIIQCKFAHICISNKNSILFPVCTGKIQVINYAAIWYGGILLFPVLISSELYVRNGISAAFAPGGLMVTLG